MVASETGQVLSYLPRHFLQARDKSVAGAAPQDLSGPAQGPSLGRAVRRARRFLGQTRPTDRVWRWSGARRAEHLQSFLAKSTPGRHGQRNAPERRRPNHRHRAPVVPDGHTLGDTSHWIAAISSWIRPASSKANASAARSRWSLNSASRARHGGRLALQHSGDGLYEVGAAEGGYTPRPGHVPL